MDRNAVWKWLVLALLTAFAVVSVTPPKEKIRLGLDLQGGTSFTVQIDEDQLRRSILEGDPSLDEAAVAARVADKMKDADARAIEVLRNRVDRLGVNEPVIAPGTDHRILIQLPGADAGQRKAAEESLKSVAFLEFRLVHKDNARLVDQLFTASRAPEGYAIADMGDRKYFRRTADYKRLAANDPDYLQRVAMFQVPAPRYALMLEREKLKTGEEVFTPWFVKRAPEKVNGGMIKRAEVERDMMSGGVHISLEFKAEGRQLFADLTSRYALYANENRDPNPKNPDGTPWHLAIVLDGTLYSAPVLNTPIPNGKAQITGAFSYTEAAQLRNILNAGSLPVPVKLIEKRMVDSSLGKDAINSGVRAAVIASVLVALFMLIYYSYCGLLANLALLLDLILLPAGMILAGGILSIFVRETGGTRSAISLPVLTMPGIAGIVLTIGMAVDANVLIFERMREEFKAGKSARAAVAAGYKRAFLAIFDSNLTTLLTAVILFIFGSGPIRGFAVTLTAGIIVSMYTALVVTRMVFDATVSDKRVKPYRMLQLIGETKIDFLGKRQPAILFSAAVIVLTLGVVTVNGVRNPARVFAVDFLGGAAITLNYTLDQGRKPIDALRTALTAAGVNDAQIQYQSELDGSGDVLRVTTGKEAVDGQPVGKVVESALQRGLPEAGFTMVGEEMIGPQVGADLKRGAIKAIILAWIGMIIYITVRFEFGFALGALVALIHDVLFTVGVYCLFGRQISLTIVAALLTIIGYSVNDTIVIFDRVREDLKMDQRRPFAELCNLSINQTLSRTILTSLTTVIAVAVLFVFGGGSINDFALCMLIGLFAGTYSTVFIATPVMLAWYRNRRPGFVASQK